MKFENLKINKKIIKGLTDNGFTELTEIQSRILAHSLNNKNIIGSSKTGSGKTLAYLITILQKLMEAKWSKEDGLGAIILTPTRELALQIFGVLKKIGKHLTFSAGLVIGGIHSKEEKLRISRMNILVCTPGRILQHFQETEYFDGSNLLVMVVDEADKMIEMGFKEDIENIIEYLSPERQTLLVSATPNAIINKLASLNLENSEIISTFETEVGNEILQSYGILKLEKKIGCLYKILKNNNKKIIVFLSTCKEVKFLYFLFQKLRVKNKLFFICGELKQEKRIENYRSFSREENGVLFSTDVGARGLDFPDVHIVVQFDCPDSVETYVHRIGRTGRNGKTGTSILFLTDNEKKIIEDVQKNNCKFSIEKKEFEYKKIDVRSLLAQFSELKEYGYKYISTYAKFLKMNSKRYFRNCDMEGLKTYFGMVDLEEGLENYCEINDRENIENIDGEKPSGTVKCKKKKVKNQNKKIKFDDDGNEVEFFKKDIEYEKLKNMIEKRAEKKME